MNNYVILNYVNTLLYFLCWLHFNRTLTKTITILTFVYLFRVCVWFFSRENYENSLPRQEKINKISNTQMENFLSVNARSNNTTKKKTFNYITFILNEVVLIDLFMCARSHRSQEIMSSLHINQHSISRQRSTSSGGSNRTNNSTNHTKGLCGC